MCPSARRSRCAVETPGFSSLSTSASTSATIRPARRIRAISAWDLRVTTSGVGAGGAVPDDLEQVAEHVVDRLEPIHPPEDAGRRVVVDDLLKARELQIEPGADGLRLVVPTLVQRRAVDVADPRDRRWIRCLVVDMPCVPAQPPSGHAAEDLLAVDLDERREVDGFASFCQGVVERLRLRAVAGETIEDRAVGRVGLIESTEQHPDRDVVRDELTTLHEPARLEADRRAVTDGSPEQVAGRDVRDPELLGEEGGLGPLPRPRCAQEDEHVHASTTTPWSFARVI